MQPQHTKRSTWPSYAFVVAVAVLCAGGIDNAQNAVPAIAVPNPQLFPGATNPDITPENISENICKKGWTTKPIRPPASYTTALKRVQLKSLGDTTPNPLPPVPTNSGKSTKPDLSKCVEHSSNVACYEEDHLISLELGGDPRSPDNLWPEPWFGPWNAHVKDTLENRLHGMVCAGEIPLRDAQQAIATDWVAAYRTYVRDVPGRCSWHEPEGVFTPCVLGTSGVKPDNAQPSLAVRALMLDTRNSERRRCRLGVSFDVEPVLTAPFVKMQSSCTVSVKHSAH
jgi:hypothetical protein